MMFATSGTLGKFPRVITISGVKARHRGRQSGIVASTGITIPASSMLAFRPGTDLVVIGITCTVVLAPTQIFDVDIHVGAYGAVQILVHIIGLRGELTCLLRLQFSSSATLFSDSHDCWDSKKKTNFKDLTLEVS